MLVHKHDCLTESHSFISPPLSLCLNDAQINSCTSRTGHLFTNVLPLWVNEYIIMHTLSYQCHYQYKILIYFFHFFKKKKFLRKSTFYYVIVRKTSKKYKILPSMCLEANGRILGTCSVWALAQPKKSHFSEFQTSFPQTYTNKINSLSILNVRRTL